MWNVYSNENELRAACQYAEDAGMLVSCLGEGTTIKYGKVVVWTEGEEDQPAGESYDYVAQVCNSRSIRNVAH